ncbi:pseudouridylate synthase RPUSD4, mitochondrial [Corythoichthys intestinalis]|uniref:pseudouridylate synthase RPUSD4, mitochondrial n=1 Tax=Corythoichthys intestinalis TaxID=161448 RepID=UPI0025A55C90|nr:pseudouridylate synthase RPUSD4, mitochondrial [Corythoichthys intestinalis]XP_061813663.1 pseudouridylate synthase RPUSD4, mitochondrial-like [Nerophis lumbriciformis]
MNHCARNVFVGKWNFLLRPLEKTRTKCHQCSGSALVCFSRSQTTATEQAPDPGKGEKTPLRAIDLARKLRQEKSSTRTAEPPLSDQQKRVMDLKRFSLQLQNVHPNVLAKHLSKSVLYQDQHLVIINKPYGLPVKDSNGETSISSVLPVLSKMMDGIKVRSDSQLLPCLGLEKEMTGALLLARSEEAVEHVLELNSSSQVQRKYWVVTAGIPVPSEGMIDIPIIERAVTGSQPHYKMALSPIYRMNDAGSGLTKVRANRQSLPAVTKYKVLDSHGGCSLVELEPLTGVKHQIRVHMAFAMSCLILGDHKYSHWSKLAPQKLPERVLGKLGLEQSKSRHLPLHLHARQLTLPRIGHGTVSVRCPLPKFFTQTLSRLNLTFPKENDDNQPPCNVV